MTLTAAVLAASVAAAAVESPASHAFATDPVFRAMRAELDRARAALRLEAHEPPYFVAARVADYDFIHIGATFGALTDSRVGTDRALDVDLRVGDRTLDNGRFVRAGRRPPVYGPELPEGDVALELQRALWLALDEAYKDAIEDLSRKRAVLAQEVQDDDDDVADFSTVPPYKLFTSEARPSFPRAAWERLATELSAVFRGHRHLRDTRVEIGATSQLGRYLDTAGGMSRDVRSVIAIEARARAQADDGMMLSDFVSFYAPTVKDLPTPAELRAATEAMATRLAERRTAPALEDAYTGPVLLEGQAAAELLLALAGWSAAVAPEPVFEDPRYAAMFEQLGGAGAWSGRLGSRVAARFLEMVDDPTRRAYAGKALIGAYSVDDEGVAPRPVTVITAGKLTGLLATRTPIDGAADSTGHGRLLPGIRALFGAARPVPGVVHVTARNDEPTTAAAVRARFLELLRDEGLDYGFAIRRVRNRAASPPTEDELERVARSRGQSPLGEPLEVYRLALDGTSTRVRGVDWGKLDVRALRDIAEASSGDGAESAFNLLSGIPGMEGFGSISVSVIAPSALVVEELELQPRSGPKPKPPVLDHPFFAESAAAAEPTR